MKYYILILATALFFNRSFSQPVVSYVDYHNKINDIEVLVRQQNYPQAISEYEELRGSYSFFAKDLHNLAICYLKTNQIDSAISIARQLVLHGRTLGSFSMYKEFAAISGNDEWMAFTEDYPLLREQYDKNLDRKFIDIITTAIEADQTFQKISDEKRDSVYYYQGRMLFDYIFDNGFPNFFRYEEEHTASSLFVMLRHFFCLPRLVKGGTLLAKQKPYSDMVFDKPYADCMLKALHDGKLLPDTYEQIMYYIPSDSPYGFVGIRFDFDTETVSLEFVPQNANPKEINEKRKSIGLAQVDSTAGNLEGTWYKQVSFQEMKEAYSNCDTCKTPIDYWKLSAQIRGRVRNTFKNEALESFKFSFNPDNLSNFHMKGSLNYMPNLKKNAVPK